MKVAFQGTKGAYSEEALYKYFGKEKTEAVGINLSEDVCDALESNQVDAAILPVENSIVGNVDINIDLIFNHNFFAIGEVYLPIRHCLLVKKGVKLKDITHAHSHPIALAQCHDFLKNNKITPHPEFDTAGSAKILSESKKTNIATIGSKLCAKYYDLEVLSENIQKVDNNITRFLVFVKNKNIEVPKGNIKTSIAFCTKHHPGALLGCLQEFSINEINLTKLESRPIPENPFMYIFYIDFIGGINDANVETCLRNLKSHAVNIKILGSYLCGTRPDLT